MKKNIVVILLVSFVLAGCKPQAGTISQKTAEIGDVKQEGAMMADGYQGELIAGEASPYLVFNQEDYEKALAEGKIVFLDFYANWCPICRAESPEIIAGFNGLDTDQVVGFRVNYKDPETDDNEEALAKEFKIPYQHTKVILKNGEEVFRSGDQWTQEDFNKAIGEVL